MANQIQETYNFFFRLNSQKRIKFNSNCVFLQFPKGWHGNTLENGKSQPSGDMLWRIAKASGVSMDYFMDEDADEATPEPILSLNMGLIDSRRLTERTRSSAKNIRVNAFVL
ncbi:MAG: helix-turn-helix domain-containing protein [Desulfobacula sp.]|nr:helix-turn-helix domain-containing protein [Desulfobacula sp.]